MTKELICKISYAKLEGFFLASIVFLCSFKNKIINGYIPFLPKIQNYLSIGLLLLLIILNFIFCQKIKVKKTTLMLGGFIGVILFSTIIFHRNLNAASANLFPMLVICLSLDLTNHNRKAFISYIDTLKYLLMAIVLIDVATQIIYPNGMYSTIFYDINWFLGYKTERMIYSIPMIIMFYYSSYEKKGYLDRSSFLALILGIVNAVLSQGTGCSVILLLCGFFTIILNSGKGGKLYKFIVRCLDCRLIFGIYVAAFFMLVVVEKSQIMAYVAELFGKSPNFSGRTKIWSGCLNIFLKSPLFGNGYLLTDEYVLLAHFKRATNAHNSMISIIVSGGLIALVFYFAIYFYTLIKAKKYTKIEMLLTIFVYMILMLGLTSSIYIFSPFSFLAFWLMEREKTQNRTNILSDVFTNKRKGRKKIRCSP